MADIGRPTEYDPEYCEQAYKLCLAGLTDKQLADFFEVTEATITNWKHAHAEFTEALKRGKMIADATIAESLYHSAKGYSHPDTDIKVIDGKIVTTNITKHYPPNATSAIFWLKNRQKDKWRDKQEIDHTNNGEGFDRVPNVQIIVENPHANNENQTG